MYYSHQKITTPDQKRFPKHMHNDFEILYFIHGDADYIVESSVYHLKKNDLLLITPRIYHNLIPKSSVSYERFVINFTEDEISSLVANDMSSTPGIFSIPAESYINHFFEAWSDCENLFDQEELECFIKKGLSSVLLFLKYYEKKSVNFPIQENLTLQNILQYIDQNPEEIITAESLSAKFFVSVSWIVHIFQKYLGISLMKYISKKKMLYAQQLIRAGYSPTDVAERCNFENYATFYRQYKKILHKSPKEDKK
jgi:YesN/AraC family two-component response regulator